MITSAQNQKLKTVRALLEKSRARRSEDAFVVEGEKMYREIPPADLAATYMSESFAASHPEIRGEAVREDIFRKLSDTRTPQGILAVVRQRHYSLEDILKRRQGRTSALFLMLEGIQDPGNLGTIIRTGEGAGVSLVIMDKKTADIYSPKVVRSTMGSVFRVPFFYSDNLVAAAGLLKEHGVRIHAAAAGASERFDRMEFDGRTAFVIGNEGSGISAELLKYCPEEDRVAIPMKGQVESLNAAVSAALLMYRYAGLQR